MAKKKATEEPANAGELQVRNGGRWQKGQSGNPIGSKQGSRHKVSLAVEALLEGQAEKLTEKAIDAALGGDMVALRLCLDRLCPVRRDRPVHFEAPELRNPDDALGALSGIVQAMANGILTANEASAAANIVGSFIRAVEAKDHEERIRRLEDSRAKA
jgi:hypothetical protein